MEYLEDNFDTRQDEDGLYKFKSIKDHRGPYTSTDLEYLGSSYNLLIDWETGKLTWEPLSNSIADDSYSCAVYAKKFDLLNTQEWKEPKRDLSEPLRNPSTDKPRHPGDLSIDGKFQGIMHMSYNLIFRMLITNGDVLLILRN